MTTLWSQVAVEVVKNAFVFDAGNSTIRLSGQKERMLLLDATAKAPKERDMMWLLCQRSVLMDLPLSNLKSPFRRRL